MMRDSRFLGGFFGWLRLRLRKMEGWRHELHGGRVDTAQCVHAVQESIVTASRDRHAVRAEHVLGPSPGGSIVAVIKPLKLW